MTKVPSVGYKAVTGLLSVQRGSHIRLQKYTSEGISNPAVPVRQPIERSTLSPSEASLQTNEP
uniref:Uncharacterized protein n=1 Tax=Candidatus Kentrum sp. UNK TaxID=2126344 RepID=A0A451AHS3_9GAMM|nr:MAG: hypothetical protein BECKUNK1418G_GA0071005_106521 [Candidatus Kentron sp. UNK]VFK71527.1 MAG: hypothetical protein BECKUNK1418H_GA0071006_107021 [Candidatus Kentron sp. UNK]